MDKKIILLGIFAILFMMPLISAWDFDNAISYKQESSISTITNAFGLGSDLAELQRVTPQHNYVIAGENRKVMIINVENFGDLYLDGIQEMTIKNLRTNKEEVKNYHWEYAIYGDVPIYENKEVCKLITLSNGSATSCHNIKVENGSEKQIIEWKEVNSNDLPKGKTTYALVTDVKAGDYYDGIPKFMGKEITQWAVWQDSYNVGLVAYYPMENTTDVRGLYNFKLDDGFKTPDFTSNGKIAKSFNGTYGAKVVMVNDTNLKVLNTTKVGYFSTCGWYRGDGTTQTQYVWYSSVSAQACGETGFSEYNTGFTYTDSYGNPAFMITSGGHEDISTDLLLETPITAWTFVCMTKNTTHMEGYINGVGIQTSSLYAVAWTENPDRLIIGGGECGGSAYNFKGKIDELGFWNRQLSSTEISDMYNGGTGMTYVETIIIIPSLNLSIVTPTSANVSIGNTGITYTTEGVTQSCKYTTNNWATNTTITCGQNVS
jgi:hypothetical protein